MITIILCSHYKIFGYLLYIVLGLKNMYYLIRNGLSIIIFLISFIFLYKLIKIRIHKINKKINIIKHSFILFLNLAQLF